MIAPPEVAVEVVDGAPRFVTLTFTAPNGQQGMLRVENVVATMMTVSEPSKAILAWCEAIKAAKP